MIYLIAVLLFLMLIIAVYNYLTAPVFRSVNASHHYPQLVSILIPARNEETNIARCLEAVINQSYTNFEVIVGNDNSTDETETISKKYSKMNPCVRIINIPELQTGWKGKNFTAHILSKYASGDFLLFIDADVVLNKEAVSSAVHYMNKYKTDLLSVFPGQLNITFGEKLIVPLLNFFLLSLLPLIQVYKSGRPSLAAGIGQFMMFRKSAYKITGGHEVLKNEIVEDVELVRKAKRMKLKVLTMIDGGLAVSRMYRSLPGAINGFSKNFFKGSKLPGGIFIILLTLYFTLFFLPFIAVFFNAFYIFAILLIFLIRGLISNLSGQSYLNILLHPLQMLLFYFIGIRSFLFGNKVKWKGRPA